MRVLLVAILFIFAPSIVHSQDTVAATYSMLFSADRAGHGEGVIVSYEMADKRTRISSGFFHTAYSEKLDIVDPTPIAVSVTGEVAGMPIDADISIGELSYSSHRKYNIYDVMLQGEYNYLDRTWGLGNKSSWHKSHSLKLWAGMGAKIDISTYTASYKIFLDGKEFDTIENPLSESKSSGIKFFLSHGVSYRLSLIHIGVDGALSIPDVDKSFITLRFGFSI